jgi:hypothetical protein
MKIEAIEASLSRCDTIRSPNGEVKKYLFFDDEDRLRKYRTHYSYTDGTAEYLDFLVFYNQKGELIYLDYKHGCHCDDGSGYFVIHNGKITERNILYDCGCCEEDDTTSTTIMPDIGSPLPRLMHWWDCSSFSDAKTLLGVLRIYEYEYLFNAEFTGKENVFANILDYMDLKTDTIFFDEKGFNYATRSYDEVGRIRKCNISNSSENGSEYYIKLYYDIDSQLFFTECTYCEKISDNNTLKEQFGIYFENEIVTGIKYYYNPEFNNISEADYLNKSDQIYQLLINTRLDKTPYFKKDFSGFLNTDKLKKTLLPYH